MRDPRDPDPRIDDATRRRLTRLVDAIDVGPAPTLDDLIDLTEATSGTAETGLPSYVGNNGSDNGQHGRHELVTARRQLPKRTLLAGIAAVIALLLAALAVLHDGPDGGPTNIADDPHRNVPPLLIEPGAVPAGLELQGAIDLPPEFDQLMDHATVTLYGTDGPDDPLGAGDLAVAVVTAHDEPTVGEKGTPMTVRGHQGWVGSAGAAYDGLGIVVGEHAPLSWVRWRENATTDIALMSRTLTAETLTSVAEDLTVEGRRVDLGTVPDDVGDIEIGHISDLRFDMTTPYALNFGPTPYAPGYAAGHSSYYGTMNTIDALVATYTGDECDLAVARWMAAASRAVVVRGRRGWTSRADSGLVPIVDATLWEESDGMIGLVAVAEMPGGAGLTVAEALVEATDDQWHDLGVTPDDFPGPL
jgi:hypothetical protein